MITICLITDLHISEEGDCPQGIDTRFNFLKVLHQIIFEHPDFLVIGGDLTHKTGDSGIYNWIKNHLIASKLKYLIIPGNHDDPVLLAECFGFLTDTDTNELYYSCLVADRKLIFLDTSSYKMSDKQFEWLRIQITESTDDKVLIFMHHPPVTCFSAHMEPKYAFEQMDRFMSLCADFPTKQFIIFCGHYHLDRTVYVKNIEVVITPSTFVQVHPDYEYFVPLMNKIGYRKITFTKSGGFFTDLIPVKS